MMPREIPSVQLLNHFQDGKMAITASEMKKKRYRKK